MARKDLSRTVIEGGRRYYNSFSRRASHGTLRAATRTWLDRIRSSVDVDDDDDADTPVLRRVRKDFYDKLGPAERWLRSQLGRPWDRVYADLCAEFDTRTIAGRHVVHDHMLPWVRRWDVPDTYFRARFVIDEHGILRLPPFANVSHRKLRLHAGALAQGRFAANTYRGWLWFRPEESHPIWQHVPRRYVEVAPLTRANLRTLFALPSWLRDEIVIASPLPTR